MIFRLLSYYYDNETGLYYLQSRYYDPAIGRYICSDGYASTAQGIIGFNMFAYCGNGPITHQDMSGYRYVAATTVGAETSEERSLACQHQNQIAQTRPSTTSKITPSTSTQTSNLIENAVFNVLNDDGYAFYGGSLVINAGEGASAFTYGIIFMQTDGNANLLRHEYGHTRQMKELGLVGYTISVVIPSVMFFNLQLKTDMPSYLYYSLPWEYKADEMGGANHTYTSWAKTKSDSYWELTEKIFSRRGLIW